MMSAIARLLVFGLLLASCGRGTVAPEEDIVESDAAIVVPVVAHHRDHGHPRDGACAITFGREDGRRRLRTPSDCPWPEG